MLLDFPNRTTLFCVGATRLRWIANDSDVIFVGALMGFTLARFEYFSLSQFCSDRGSGVSSAAPGECYYYQGGHYKVGIQMHLVTILPAAFLVCFQFTPAIRHRFRFFHRVNGYIVIILSQFSTAGALMIVRRAFGGTLSTQTAVGMLAFLSTTGSALAYINIKRLQIDQHRAWMIRTWVYVSETDIEKANNVDGIHHHSPNHPHPLRLERFIHRRLLLCHAVW
jgi:uncharacterized membrane protein